MTQISYFWATTGVGDGALVGYSQDNITEVFRALASGLSGADLGGVCSDYQNELAVSGASSPVAVATGAAFVYGFFFRSSASENVAVSTPSVSTRIDRVVLRVDWTAQTVRIALVAGAEGGSAPALTQTAGTTWEMKLAQVSITTGGVITVTDEREWLNMVGDGMVSTDKLAASAVTTAKIAASNITNALMADDAVNTAEIANGAVTAAKLADGAALAEILDDDGAGSLLDADLLDGVEGSGYSTTSHNHTLDGLSNVNMAGKLTDDFAKWNGTAWVPAVPSAGTPADNSVTMAKLADLATDSLIGRDAAGTGDPIAITLGASLSFTGSNSIQRAALTGDVTAAANSNATVIADDIIEYTDMRAQYAQPMVIYSPGANQDFTTVVTVDFDTVSIDYDGPGIISNDGAGAFTVSVACYVEITVSGSVGHASGTAEAWCNVYIEIGTSASSYSTLGKTGRIFYVPASNWGSFHTSGVISRAINEKIRVRIERAGGSDMLRLNADSAITLKVIAS